MRPSFDELVRNHGGRIRQIARRYADPGSVDDLVQDILVRVWRSLPQFRGDSRIESWIYRIALNASMSSIKTRVRDRERKSALAATSIVGPELPAGASADDMLIKFLEMLGEIDALVVMMHLDGLSSDEMSTVLGITANAINIRITRLRQKFIDAFVN